MKYGKIFNLIYLKLAFAIELYKSIVRKILCNRERSALKAGQALLL